MTSSKLNEPLSLQDFLDRSIKLINVPASADKETLINTFNTIGSIIDITRGKDNLIITYDDASSQEMAFMFNGVEFSEDYKYEIVKPVETDFPRKAEGNKSGEQFQDDFEIIQDSDDEKGNSGSQANIKEIDEGLFKPKMKKEKSLEIVEKAEIKEKEIEKQAMENVEKVENEEKEVAMEEIRDKVAEEIVKEVLKADVVMVESDREVENKVNQRVKEVVEKNVKETVKEKKEPEFDPFQDILQPNFFLWFTVIWAFCVFLRSLC